MHPMAMSCRDGDGGRFFQSIQVPSSMHPGTTYTVWAIPHSDISICKLCLYRICLDHARVFFHSGTMVDSYIYIYIYMYTHAYKTTLRARFQRLGHFFGTDAGFASSLKMIKMIRIIRFFRMFRFSGHLVDSMHPTTFRIKKIRYRGFNREFHNNMCEPIFDQNR